MIDAVLKINGFLDPAINEGRDPATVQQEGMLFLHAMAQQLAEQRRADPQDDLMTALVQAEIDGQHLTQMQISSFFVLLTAAGNDTTRDTTSVGMRALALHPEQRSDLVADLDGLLPVAIEEILRWASPVLTMRRTATRDVVIADAHIRKGDKVVLFYAAANFDEKVFENPLEFDIRRSPNKHVSFGGGGPHFCLGNQLAKMQLTSLFTELLTRVPDLEVGEPVYEINTTIRSIREMPFTFTPAAHD
tara:strand:+ start:199 stop:939 length:741 start_codon:yes stop_codon:yes gene_type:complete